MDNIRDAITKHAASWLSVRERGEASSEHAAAWSSACETKTNKVDIISLTTIPFNANYQSSSVDLFINTQPHQANRVTQVQEDVIFV